MAREERVTTYLRGEDKATESCPLRAFFQRKGREKTFGVAQLWSESRWTLRAIRLQPNGGSRESSPLLPPALPLAYGAGRAPLLLAQQT